MALLRDPGVERLHEIRGELLGRGVVQLAALVEQRWSVADVRLGVRHRDRADTEQHLPQLMVCRHAAERAVRLTHDAAGLAAPDALAPRTRADIDRVLQRAGDTAV